MGSRMKNFNIFWVHWKIQFSGTKGSRKTILKGAWTVCWFKESACPEKGGGGGCFWGGVLIPQCTLWTFKAISKQGQTIMKRNVSYLSQRIKNIHKSKMYQSNNIDTLLLQLFNISGWFHFRYSKKCVVYFALFESSLHF